MVTTELIKKIVKRILFPIGQLAVLSDELLPTTETHATHAIEANVKRRIGTTTALDPNGILEFLNSVEQPFI
jgi:hypothetical protein